MNDLETVLKELNKKYGDNSIGNAATMPKAQMDRFHSGSYFLDWSLNGGLPTGRIVEYYGPQGSGKSVMCQKMIAAAQRKGKTAVWIDAERAFDVSFATKLGVDVSKLAYTQLKIGEDVFDLVIKLLRDGAPDIIVIDSIASLTPLDDFKPMEKATMATTARLLSRGLRVANAVNQNTLILCINQIRTDVNAYGNPTKTVGGNSIGHYTSVRVEFRRGELYTEKDIKIGQQIKFKVTKSRVSPPLREGYIRFFYDGEIDKVDDIVSVGLITNKIERAGAYYSIAGEKFMGRVQLEERLNSDAKFFIKVVDEVFDVSKKRKTKQAK